MLTKTSNLINKLSLQSTVDNRLWTVFIFIFLSGISIHSFSQSVVKAEYFFDTDPGVGNGTVIPFTPTGGNVTFTTNISTVSLSQGFHQLAIRVKETGGPWSQFESRGFYITATTSDAANITAAEYFFDTDPGNGNGTSIAVTAGATTNFTVSIPTTSLSAGFHFLAIRTKGANGKWGIFEGRGFYITSSTSNVPNLVAAEYFFDADPGNGNGTPISITAGATSNFTISLPATGLQSGFHFLAIRTKDANGKWGIFESRGFYVTGSTTDAPNITKAEYFFDTDPGNGNGISIPITGGATSNFTATIPTTGLTTGFHFLAIRTQGADGKWGIFESRGFYVSPINGNAGDIVAAEYYIDTDPGEGNGLALTVAPTGPTINQVFPIALTGVPSGSHTFNIRVQDSQGLWSPIESGSFTVLACTPPVSPTVPTVSRCSIGTVTLAATGATGTQVYRWFDDAVTATVLFTGPSFVTPILSASRNYFVSIFDPSTLCESNRVSVAAVINFASKPIINPSGTLSFCEGNSVILSAPSGFPEYVWSNGELTRQILVSAAGNYSVQVGDGVCLSPASDTVKVSVVAALAKPSVTVIGNTTICGTGTVDLTGPAGFEYTWSTGATTQTITVSQTGVFFLIVKSGGNCPSLPSDAVAVTVLTPPCDGGGGTNQPPVIATNPLSAQIEGSVQVDLTQIVSDDDDNIDYSTFRVIDNITSRGVPATIDASYFLFVDYSGNPFTGTDRVTLEVCDLTAACVQQVIDIEVVGEVKIYNGLTPDGDGYNDFMVVKYVDVVEGASQNKVTILNRWGDVVWDINNYNNTDRVFIGESNGGKELPSGTYFYKVELASGKLYTGYITLKR